jgi:hypothetical protein
MAARSSATASDPGPELTPPGMDPAGSVALVSLDDAMQHGLPHRFLPRRTACNKARLGVKTSLTLILLLATGGGTASFPA